MSFVQNLGSLRTPVASFTNLPLSGNVEGDIRIVLDIGAAYTWINSNGTGTFVDWKKLTVSNYSDLTGAPSSSPLDIDNAVKSFRSVYLNLVLYFYKTAILFSSNVLKMSDGVIDDFNDMTAVNTTDSVNEDIYTDAESYNYSLDSYTKLLLHADDLTDSSLTGNTLIGGTVDTGTKKFGTGSFHIQDETDAIQIASSDDLNLGGHDGAFTIDCWFRLSSLPVSNGNEMLLVSKKTLDGGDNTSFTLGVVKTNGDTVVKWYPFHSYGVPIVGTTALSINTWYHVAVSRSAGVDENTNAITKLFLDGGLEGTHTQEFNIDSSTDLVIGGGMNSTNTAISSTFAFDGYIDEVRIVKGISKFYTDFEVATTAYHTPTGVSVGNLTLISNVFEANTAPTSARIVIFEDDGILSVGPTVSETIIENTDIKAYISRDAGTTFTQVTLTKELDILRPSSLATFLNTTNLIVGTVDISTQPNGKEIVYKITTHNNKELLVRSVAVNWK